MARPSTYNFELCKEICEEIAIGRNIIDVLKSDERFPSWPAFRQWKNEHTELSTLYVKAIQDKSEAVLQEIDAISEDLKNGVYEASVANVLIQTLKWKAAKFYPKMFGDKVQNEVTIREQPLFPE